MMALFEVGPLVSEENLPFPRAQGFEQAIRHNNAAGFTGGCVCDWPFSIKNLESVPACTSHGPTMVHDHLPHSHASSKKQDRCDRALHEADLVVEWDDWTHLEKSQHQGGAGKESSGRQSENCEGSPGSDCCNECEHANDGGRVHGPAIQASRNADERHQQAGKDERDCQTG